VPPLQKTWLRPCGSVFNFFALSQILIQTGVRFSLIKVSNLGTKFGTLEICRKFFAIALGFLFYASLNASKKKTAALLQPLTSKIKTNPDLHARVSPIFAANPYWFVVFISAVIGSSDLVLTTFN